jgi:hypothetical protein
VTAPGADDQAVLIIPAGGDSAEDLVRAWVAAALDGVPLVPRLRVALVVEELVSNAHRHGGLPCVLRLSRDESHHFLQVYVDDSGVDDGAEWVAGSGLSLVDGLTSHWSVEWRARGKTVWGEVGVGIRVGAINAPPQPPPRVWPGRA